MFLLQASNEVAKTASDVVIELPAPPASFPEWAAWAIGVGVVLLATFTVYKVKFAKKSVQ